MGYILGSVLVTLTTTSGWGQAGGGVGKEGGRPVATVPLMGHVVHWLSTRGLESWSLIEASGPLLLCVILGGLLNLLAP